MRIVPDTNVFISGVFFGGLPGRVLEAWRDGAVEVVISPEIIEEYVRVGERLAERFLGVDLGPVLELLAGSAILVAPKPLPEPISQDADDDKFLACALSGQAEYIVSGDRDFLEVSAHQGVIVQRPRDFVSTLGRG